MNLFSDGLFFPAACLALLGWIVPKLMSMLLAEGIKPLMINAFASTVVMFVISSALFAAMYIGQGVGWADLVGFGWGANVVFFGKLGLISALIWGPVLVLSVANLPRSWIKAVW